MDENVEQKLARYKQLTRQALEKVTVLAAEGSREHEIAKDFLQMARNYYRDAGYFEEQGNLLTALAACSYAHAWLDAGVRAGLLDCKGDERLFTVP